MSNPLVIFSTKTWQGDYQKILAGGYNRKYQHCNFPFIQKWLFLNNITDPVPDEAWTDRTDADLVLKTPELASEVLTAYNLTEDSFNGGYWYSIQELTELMLAASMGIEYLVHYSSDALNRNESWIEDGIARLQQDPSIKVVSPKSEVNTWGEVDQFFSDQCYLIRPSDFYGQDFTIAGDIPEYPQHGGDSFEKKMAKIMRQNGWKRAILQDKWYDHEAW